MPRYVYPILLLALCSLAARATSPSAKGCDVPSLGDESPTDGYLRLLRRLALERGALEREDLEEIAGSEQPIIPSGLASGTLSESAALPFRRSLAGKIAAGLDWERVREHAREMLGARERSDVRRADAEKATDAVLAPLVLEPDLAHDVAGAPPFVRYQQFAVGRNATYVMPEGGHTERNKAIRFIDGRAEVLSLPTTEEYQGLVASRAGRVLAVSVVRKDGGNQLLVTDLETNTLVRSFPVEAFAVNTKFELYLEDETLYVKRSANQSQHLDRFPLKGAAEPSSESLYQQLLSFGQDGKLYAAKMAGSPEKLSLYEVSTGKTLFEERVRLSQARSLESSVWFGADGAGKLFLAIYGEQGKREISIHDVLAKDRKTHSVAGLAILPAWVSDSHGNLRFVSRDAGGSVVAIDPYRGTLKTHPSERTYDAKPVTFTGPRGNLLDVTLRWTDRVGEGFRSRLDLFDIETGAIQSFDVSGMGLQNLQAVQTAPDGRVFAYFLTRADKLARVQLYGPLVKR